MYIKKNTVHCSISGKLWEDIKVVFYKSYKKNLTEEQLATLDEDLKRVQNEILKDVEYNDRIFVPKYLYEIFECRASENIIYLTNDKIVTRDRVEIPLEFPKDRDRLISEYVEEEDLIAFIVTTGGLEYVKIAKKWTDEGKYKDAFILQSIAIAAAEVLVDKAQIEVEKQWYHPFYRDFYGDKYDDTNKKFRRFSFGYPIAPNLEMQKIIWDLVNPEEGMGVSLTDEYMIYPEASISAFLLYSKI